MSLSCYPKATWRLLIDTIPQPGAFNMAIDEFLLRQVANKNSPPVLRLYQWSQPTLTLGRGQPVADADRGMLIQDNIKLLRRMTGGTAVLNDGVVSYSLAVKSDDARLAGSVAESYRGVSMALAAGFLKLGLAGVRADAMDPVLYAQNLRERSPVCFEIPSYYEITVDGRKLVGNSQMRIRGGVLQHGSVYIDGDIAHISRYLTAKPTPQRIRSKTITLGQALGTVLSFDDIVYALREGFRQVLNLEFVTFSLEGQAIAEVNQLCEEKYENPAWTNRL